MSRPVVVFKWVQNPDYESELIEWRKANGYTVNARPTGKAVKAPNRKIKADSYTGQWVAWGIDNEEMDSGIGNFTTALIEMADGEIRTPPANMIKFLGVE